MTQHCTSCEIAFQRFYMYNLQANFSPESIHSHRRIRQCYLGLLPQAIQRRCLSTHSPLWHESTSKARTDIHYLGEVAVDCAEWITWFH